MLLVFMICGGIVVNNILDPGPASAKILSIAIIYGFSVAVSMYATANTSGTSNALFLDSPFAASIFRSASRARWPFESSVDIGRHDHV